MSQNDSVPLPANFVQMAIVTYGVMAVIGGLIMHFGHDHFVLAHTAIYQVSWLKLGTIASLVAFFLLVVNHLFEAWIPSYNEMRDDMGGVLSTVSVPTTIFLALLSAVAEEWIFRGAIQPFAGIFATSVLFAILHLGKNGRLTFWSLWAFMASLILGYMFEVTQNLAPCILAHFFINVFSMLRLRQQEMRKGMSAA